MTVLVCGILYIFIHREVFEFERILFFEFFMALNLAASKLFERTSGLKISNIVTLVKFISIKAMRKHGTFYDCCFAEERLSFPRVPYFLIS